ncbi:MAG: dihydromethanopterin reductase (acceptor) [Methanothrix sp.]|uniref:dihydromethanopterin reductase (acceptor) n=1 Tax=Methanothrix sp. TaxID=90426 RepID=UPI0025EC0625|nr:dihydromethanopterin reductase (acceptor) [Methanothrix sp.]MCQ8903552.1 dihydromethanopterin reductase (acceptor) [Methanothrix sp.]
MRRVAWGITGGGQYLAESVRAMREVAARNKVCTFVSRAGEEVLRMYGLLESLREISGGGYLEEIFMESESGRSFPMTGRLMLGRYDLLLIAPATSNTVAKIACGIADTIVTNAAALAEKADVPVIILPTDVREAMTRAPYAVNRDMCRACEICPPQTACPSGAISGDEIRTIDLMRCNGCGTCLPLCSSNAIDAVRMNVRRRSIDLRNIEILRERGYMVLESPEEIPEAVEGTLANRNIEMERSG